MKKYRLLLKNCLGIFLLLPLMGGCEKTLKGGEKILGTATINGQNYKESIVWAWNFQGYPSCIELYEKYRLFYFIARLSPEKGGDPSYSINFYISADDFQFRTNDPYMIDFYEDANLDILYWRDIMPYFSKNASEILNGSTDGIAFAVSSASGKRIPLKGELKLENIDSQTNICHGVYSFSSAENTSEKLVINGKFEAETFVHKVVY